jgi:hypothetical protein
MFQAGLGRVPSSSKDEVKRQQTERIRRWVCLPQQAMISLLPSSRHSRLLLQNAAISMGQLIYWIGLAAVAVSALTGVLDAGRQKMDIVGVVMAGCAMCFATRCR